MTILQLNKYNNIDDLSDYTGKDITMSKTFRSACRNKHSEDYEGFIVATCKKGLSNKISLLTSCYNNVMDNLKDDLDFYDDEGNFIPPESLEHFIENNRHYSERQLIRLYSD